MIIITIAAEWLSLHWTIELTENSTVIFEIKSLNIVVGTCELKASYFLSPKKNKIGLQKIIYPLRYKGKMKGKIKIMYKLYKEMEILDPTLELGSQASSLRRGGILDTSSIVSLDVGDLASIASIA